MRGPLLTRLFAGTIKYPNYFFGSKLPINKVGKVHKAHTGGHCTGVLKFTFTMYVGQK